MAGTENDGESTRKLHRQKKKQEKPTANLAQAPGNSEPKLNSESALIAEFLQALSEEIEAVKKKRSHSKIEVKEGKLISSENNVYLYVFDVDSSFVPQEDIPVEIEVKGEIYGAEIVSVAGDEITILTEVNLGKHVEEALIIINPWYLLEMLKKRYHEFLEGKVSLNTHLSKKLFNFTPASSGFYHGDLKLPPSENNLNDDQIAAIRAACGSDVHFIWGPPGTGKTRTIGALVAALLKQGLRVLILSHTNIATDQAIASAVKFLEDSAEYQSGKIIRYGNIHPASKLPDLVIPQKLIESRVKKHQEHIEELKAEQKRKQDELKKLENIEKMSSVCDHAMQELHKLEETLKQAEQKIQVLNLQEQDLRTKLEQMQHRLQQIHLAGKLKRLFLSLSSERFQKEAAQLEQALQNIAQERTKLLASMDSLQVAYKQAETEATQQVEKLGKALKKHGLNLVTIHTRKEELVKQIKEIENEIRRAKRNSGTRRKKEDSLPTEIIKNAKVIATTLTKATLNRILADEKFDVVIVDEASMAPLPSLYFTAGLSQKKAIMVGDFRQLPPIVTASSKMAQKWLGRDIFEQAGIQQAIDEGKKEPRLTMLRHQYRMHPEIASIPNEIFYHGQLVSALAPQGLKKITRVIKRSPLAQAPLILCDLSSINPRSNRSHLMSGRYNLYSAVVSAELAKRLAKAGIKQIGVISPYYLQARLIKKIIAESDKKTASAIKTSTVHSFQGMEEEVIIFDIAEGPLPYHGPSPLVNGFELTSQAAKLINVAITRTKAQLVIVANRDYLASKLSPDSILMRVIENVYPKAQTVDPREIVETYHCTDFERWLSMLNTQDATAHIEDTKLDNESNFYAVFFRDLLESKEEIIITSPLLAPNCTWPLLDFFTAKVKAGVTVRIFIKNLTQEDNSILKALKERKVRVIERKNLSQKFAFIDRKIIWEGTLNILAGISHDGALMHRFPYPKACEEIIAIHQFAVDYELESGIPTEQECEQCGAKMLLIKEFESLFMRCENYPQCSNYRKFEDGERVKTYITCPGRDNESCRKPMIAIRGRSNLYLQCTDPQCNTRKVLC
ncbi:MAG: hypothetical protein PWP60_253 [Candidatus Atribacteria bacterium]|jgi:hypothetical protein|uniref:AAA domain-containing protein n=1 Tax=Thermatribacter velox TaxID=3039681 RepID=A0ABZ2Y972_9BACT|nr:hypothetical protein [Candidatus Atribacteria bacterium]